MSLKSKRTQEQNLNPRPQIVVVGGSFAGLRVAKGLACTLCKSQHKDVDILLIEPRDYWEYAPGMAHVVCGSGYDNFLIRPLNDVLPTRDHKIEHMRAVCLGWDTKAKLVTVRRVLPDHTVSSVDEQISFDILVLCTGMPYTSAIKPRYTARKNVLSIYQRHEQVKLFRCELLGSDSCSTTVVIYGAGLIGVELAAELAYRRRHQQHGAQNRVILMSRSGCVSALPPPAGKMAAGWLTTNGVELISDTVTSCCDAITDAAGQPSNSLCDLTTRNGLTLKSVLFVNCTGTEVPPVPPSSDSVATHENHGVDTTLGQAPHGRHEVKDSQYKVDEYHRVRYLFTQYYYYSVFMKSGRWRNYGFCYW
jgi:NADH dehydrogenase FAD-containing subunit